MTHAAESTAQDFRGPIPLVIAVTGHRDLRSEDIGKLEELVRVIFAEIARKYPHTSLVLLSPLAEGADGLAARVALEMDIRLIVPMPLARDLYEQDFKSPASREEFRDVLAKARQSFELPLLPGHTEQEIRAPGEARNHQYAQVGGYIARHTQILIALWDGQESKKVGGTAQVVKFKLEGVPEPYGPARSPLDPPESGPVYHVVTPRISNPQPANAFTLRRLYPSAYATHREGEVAYSRIFGRIDLFNADASLLRDEHLTKREQSQESVVPQTEVKLSMSTTGLLEWYGIADTLSQRFQRQDLWILRVMVVLGIATVVFLQLASGATQAAWYHVYLATLGLAYAVYALARWKDMHGKSLDYRALAEGLRVQMFWRLAGLHDSVADHYLRKQRGDLDWIRQALRIRTIPSTKEALLASTEAPHPERLELVLRRWVQDQAGYFQRSILRDHARKEFFRWIGYGLFLLPLLLAVIKPFFVQGHPFIIVMGLSLAVAAALPVYAKVQGYSEHSKQYARLQLFFGAAEKTLQEWIKARKYAEAQDLLLELGKEALVENGDWVLLHRERPAEPKA
jgi:hypothetical protein